MRIRLHPDRLTNLSSQAPRRCGGFTLLEVILAIVIATGLLVVALYFYNQSARLRGELIQQSERLSAVRLLMDRLSADLRTARADAPAAFVGDSTTMQFAHAELPLASLRAPVIGRSAGVESDLILVSYAAQTSREGSNTVVHGITRTEEPLLDARHLEALTVTNAVSLGSDTVSTNLPATPLTEDIHFLRFSYWDGQAWADVWRSAELPQGVQVSVGMEPLPEDVDPIDYPYELFRRIILLPAGGLSRRTTTPSSQPASPALATAPPTGGSQ